MYEAEPNVRRNRALPFAELIFTLVAIAMLVFIASPLSAEAPSYPFQARYLDDLGGPKDGKAEHAIWLLSHLNGIFAALAIGGWVALRLARSQLSRPATVALISALWLGEWALYFCRTDNTAWLIAFTIAATIGGVFAAMKPKASATATNPHPRPNHALAYPGWVLFTGLGLIWLVDYCATAHPKLRYLAANQIDSLFIAYVVITLVAACAGGITGVAARLFAAIDKATAPQPASGIVGIMRRLAPLAIPLLFLVWAAAVVIIFGPKRPALTSELLRLPFYLIGGWVLYRWALHGRAVRAVGGAALGILAIIVGLVGTRDFGQVLLIGLGLTLATGIATALILGGSRPAVLAGALTALTLVWVGLGLINNYGHLVSTHIGHRAEALNTPFSGKLEYLSELRWFAAGTPTLGHGLTAVPYCGTLGSVNTEATCDGVPREMHSDYVFAGIAGAWGAWVAFGISTALAFWLVSLVRVRALRRAGDPGDLRQWVFTCFVVVTLVQLLFTCLGSVGLVPLTGVTYPLLAYGGASLIASAAMLGVALQR